MLLDSKANQTKLYHSHRVFASNAAGEKSLLCWEHTDPDPEMMPHTAHEPASSKQSLLNIGYGSDSCLQQAFCLTSAFPDVVEVQPQCAFYCIIIIMIHTEHDCSTIRCELLLISTTILPAIKQKCLSKWVRYIMPWQHNYVGLSCTSVIFIIFGKNVHRMKSSCAHSRSVESKSNLKWPEKGERAHLKDSIIDILYRCKTSMPLGGETFLDTKTKSCKI